MSARTNQERYDKAHALMRKVLELAHARGMQMAMGFEFGIHPPELLSVVPPESRIRGAMVPDPLHSANIEILHAALDDIVDSYPAIDWIWLWLHEHSMFVAEPVLTGDFKAFYEKEKANFTEAAYAHDVFTGVWSLAYIREAQRYLARRAPKVRLVIGGWGSGVQLPPVLQGLDRALPPGIVFSCLNGGGGARGHAPVMAEIARHRPVWAIPWLEYDGALWHMQPHPRGHHHAGQGGSRRQTGGRTRHPLADRRSARQQWPRSPGPRPTRRERPMAPRSGVTGAKRNTGRTRCNR